MVLLDVYVGIALYGLHQSALYLSPRVVGMMKNTELRVATLSVKVEGAVLLAVEVHSPANKLRYL